MGRPDSSGPWTVPCGSRPALAGVVCQRRMKDLGVVEPIRLPPRLEARLRAVPRLAWLFVALAAGDIVGRWTGSVAPPIDFAYATPLSIITTFVPHDLYLVLPALLLVRNPGAAGEIPGLFGATIALALAELLRDPVASVLAGDGSLAAAPVAWSIVVTLLFAGGWLAMARGLLLLERGPVAAEAAGLANLAALIVLTSGAIGLIVSIAGSWGSDLTGDPATDAAIRLAWLVSPLRVLGFAVLVRSATRAAADRQDGSPAALLVAAGVLFVVVEAVVGSIVEVVGPGDPALMTSIASLTTAIAWLGETAGISLILLALPAGLAGPLPSAR
jgi:hypothetical protein